METRVGIVGGGPIGLELAVALAREGIDYQVIEAQEVGHTITWWAPQTRWFSSNERIAIAGVPLETPDQAKATREQYLTYLRGIVRQFELWVRTFEPVVDLYGHEGNFTIVTAPRQGERRLDCESVVLAIGGTDRPRRLGIEGEDLPHVDGYFREPHRYFGRRVLVIGGRNSAVEGALRAHHAGAHVALSYRQPKLPSESIKYWLLPEISGLIRAGRIEGYFDTQAVRITPTHVTLRRMGGDDAGEEFDVQAEEVLSLIGYEQDKSLLRRAGVNLVGEPQRPEFDHATMQTNIPGLYVAGTAVAGTQGSHFKIFVENCHEHVDRIVAHLQGREPPDPEAIGTSASRLAEQIETQPES